MICLDQQQIRQLEQCFGDSTRYFWYQTTIGVWGCFLRLQNYVPRTTCMWKSTWLILFVVDLSLYSFWHSRSSTVFSSSWKPDSSICPTFAQSNIPVKIHLLAGVSLGRLPLTINPSVIHPPSCTSGEVGPLPFPPRCIWGMWHATAPTHTPMEIYPQTLQNQHGRSDGGSLIHPCQ